MAVMNGKGGGTGGRLSGMKIDRIYWIEWAVYTLVVGFITVLEIANQLAVLGSLNVVTPAWQAWVNGWSSVAALFALYPYVRSMAFRAQPGCAPLWKIVLFQASGAAAFWVLHYAGCSLIRLAAYPAFDGRYHIASDPILYEAQRDLPAYLVIICVMWFVAARRAGHPVVVADTGAAAPVFFDIRDKAQVTRVATGDILAVSSAGNYVEFHLGAGRKPLMRATLAKIETRLKPHGFARTHRSWIANTACVSQISPTGAGDFTLTLHSGLQIPLSRRFRGQFDASGEGRSVI